MNAQAANFILILATNSGKCPIIEEWATMSLWCLDNPRATPEDRERLRKLKAKIIHRK